MFSIILGLFYACISSIVLVLPLIFINGPGFAFIVFLILWASWSLFLYLLTGA